MMAFYKWLLTTSVAKLVSGPILSCYMKQIESKIVSCCFHCIVLMIIILFWVAGWMYHSMFTDTGSQDMVLLATDFLVDLVFGLGMEVLKAWNIGFLLGYFVINRLPCCGKLVGKFWRIYFA